jgi:hypothetical protein
VFLIKHGFQVKSILKEGDPDKVARVEQQILEIWDRVYQSWVSGHFAAAVGPQVDSAAVQDSWDSFVNDVSSTPGMRPKILPQFNIFILLDNERTCMEQLRGLRGVAGGYLQKSR